MASTKRHTSLSLADRLYAEPETFDFHQAVRLLSAINYEKVDYKPHWKQYPVGFDRSHSKETVHFKTEPTLRYHSGDISQLIEPVIDPVNNRLKPTTMKVTFTSLTGANGILPMHYSEKILKQNRNKNKALAEFFDMFTHRAISFYHRGWEKYRIEYHFERVRRSGYRKDKLTTMLEGISGIPSLKKDSALNPDSLLFFSGLFANQQRTAHGLAAMLSDYFSVPVEIKQFVGRWNKLSPSECTRMPSKTQPSGQFNRLAKDAVLGTRAWYSQGKFRIILGPLNKKQFQSFLPGKKALAQLKLFTEKYASPELSYDIQLISTTEDQATCQLDSKNPMQLGYFTWLGKIKSKAQQGQLILT